MTNVSYWIAPGVFSKSYDLPDGNCTCITYHTPSRFVGSLDGDAARVWWQIFTQGKSADGVSANRLAQQFGIDVAIIWEFMQELISDNLLVTAEERNVPKKFDVREDRPKTFIANPIINEFRNKLPTNAIMTLSLELTYRCNEKCIHCYCPNQRGSAAQELTCAQIEQLLDEFQAEGGFNIGVTGGEIFLRSDINDILRLFIGRNLMVSFSSNLTLLSEETLELLTQLHPRTIGCSIYSADPAIHNHVTQLPGSFHKSIAAIKRIIDTGIATIIKCPLMSVNAAGYQGVVDLANSLGIPYQFDFSITAKNDGDNTTTDLRVHDEDLIREIVEQHFPSIAQRDEPVADMGPVHRDSPICGVGNGGLHIEPTGNIKPCIGLNIVLGMWPQMSLRHAYEQSPELNAVRNARMRDVEKCESCEDFAFCVRCPGAWMLETGSYLEPPKYSCTMGKLFHKIAERRWKQ